MPVELSSSIRILSQAEFHAIDERVMRIVFNVHNEYGRFFDEAVYKKAIAAQYPAEREVRIEISHRTFSKRLYIDLLFEHGAVFEVKSAELLTPAHRSQTLTYLFLSGLHHARVVNLRPEKVEYEFVSTTLTPEERRRLTVTDRAWEKVNSESLWLKEQLCELLTDWGAFLDVSLYREAITHFLGGPDRVFRPVEVLTGETAIASQRTHMLSNDTCFVLTSTIAQLEQMRNHQLRFLHHTPLRYMQWVNFNRHEITFETLKNKNHKVV
jgi:GxxExxY protein